MSLQKINVRVLANQQRTLQFVTLDDIRVGFRFHYSASLNRWFMWVLASDGTQIAGPIRLVPGLDLLLPHKYDARIPPGQLFVFGDPPTKDTVDSASLLLYRPIAQVTVTP